LFWRRLKRTTWAVAALSVILPFGAAVLLAGCSSSASPASNPHLPAVPVVSTSGPKICRQLAANLSLRQLPAAVTRLEVPSERALGRQVVATASAELRTLAGESPQSLASSLDEAAAGIAPLATVLPTQSTINRATSALDSLATTSQSICSFGPS